MGSIFDRTTLFLAALAAVLLYLYVHKSGAFPWAPAGRAGRLILNIVPKIVIGMLIGQLLSELLPREMMLEWLSDRSGWRGIATGWIAGCLVPIGAPFILLPMAAGLMKGGAGFGPIVTFLTASALLGPMRIIVYEIPIMGSGFFLTRLLAVFWMPPAAGLLAQVAARLLRTG